ncbi:hypothetical protein STH288 [Symbiobacterium thermophilum IAM 14863]|uniref:Uncharacterized protein n=1 Tax=Symbiobacterium thermophilum (strain DSM 24528 / JCM 14929 / IAM 14863 / T) TaxID=292459 RepID=Q67SS0_SYMTH|nr:hypothetical protein STH288 [Symbiobacterium thermophilum IAM 14863]
MAHGGRTNEQSPGRRLLACPGTAQSNRMLRSNSSILANRRMRTRMSGGVRGRGLTAPSYSIEPIRLSAPDTGAGTDRNHHQVTAASRRFRSLPCTALPAAASGLH